MCDYSLHLVASRPAQVGDELISTRFRNTFTRGFAALDEPDVAVCLLPGTEVAFDKDVEYNGGFIFFRRRILKEKVARFRKINSASRSEHHDALEFPEGKIVMVTDLVEGQRTTVLQLPASAQTPTRFETTAEALVAAIV